MAQYKLTDRAVQAAAPKGGQGKIKLSDGAGLSLIARSREKKYWVLRITVDGKAREVGLGSAAGAYGVSLADARDRAYAIHKALREGVALADAVKRATNRAPRIAGAVATASGLSFKEVAVAYMKRHEKGWKSATHTRQWWQSLEDYAYPVIGHKSPGEVTTDDVIAVLEPIWERMPESASRLRGRIEKIIASWKITSAEGRAMANPAQWKGHLDAHFPAVRKLHKVTHHPALPYDEVPALMQKLVETGTRSALAMRFMILTATRTSETLGAQWSEIDLDKRLWSIPVERMKAGRAHEVPLSDAAMDVLATAQGLRSEGNDAVFPGVQWKSDGVAVMSNMALLMLLRQLKVEGTSHGFRSSFRDWAADTGEDRELAEAALAHTIGGVERAYRRTQMVERRAGLMQRWSDYVAPRDARGTVVQMRKAPAKARR